MLLFVHVSVVLLCLLPLIHAISPLDEAPSQQKNASPSTTALQPSNDSDVNHDRLGIPSVPVPAVISFATGPIPTILGGAGQQTVTVLTQTSVPSSTAAIIFSVISPVASLVSSVLIPGAASSTTVNPMASQTGGGGFNPLSGFTSLGNPSLISSVSSPVLSLISSILETTAIQTGDQTANGGGLPVPSLGGTQSIVSGGLPGILTSATPSIAGPVIGSLTLPAVTATPLIPEIASVAAALTAILPSGPVPVSEISAVVSEVTELLPDVGTELPDVLSPLTSALSMLESEAPSLLPMVASAASLVTSEVSVLTSAVMSEVSQVLTEAPELSVVVGGLTIPVSLPGDVDPSLGLLALPTGLGDSLPSFISSLEADATGSNSGVVGSLVGAIISTLANLGGIVPTSELDSLISEATVVASPVVSEVATLLCSVFTLIDGILTPILVPCGTASSTSLTASLGVSSTTTGPASVSASATGAPSSSSSSSSDTGVSSSGASSIAGSSATSAIVSSVVSPSSTAPPASAGSTSSGSSSSPTSAASSSALTTLTGQSFSSLSSSSGFTFNPSTGISSGSSPSASSSATSVTSSSNPSNSTASPAPTGNTGSTGPTGTTASIGSGYGNVSAGLGVGSSNSAGLPDSSPTGSPLGSSGTNDSPVSNTASLTTGMSITGLLTIAGATGSSSSIPTSSQIAGSRASYGSDSSTDASVTPPPSVLGPSGLTVGAPSSGLITTSSPASQGLTVTPQMTAAASAGSGGNTPAPQTGAQSSTQTVYSLPASQPSSQPSSQSLGAPGSGGVSTSDGNGPSVSPAVTITQLLTVTSTVSACPGNGQGGGAVGPEGPCPGQGYTCDDCLDGWFCPPVQTPALPAPCGMGWPCYYCSSGWFCVAAQPPITAVSTVVRMPIYGTRTSLTSTSTTVVAPPESSPPVMVDSTPVDTSEHGALANVSVEGIVSGIHAIVAAAMQEARRMALMEVAETDSATAAAATEDSVDLILGSAAASGVLLAPGSASDVWGPTPVSWVPDLTVATPGVSMPSGTYEASALAFAIASPTSRPAVVTANLPRQVVPSFSPILPPVLPPSPTLKVSIRDQVPTARSVHAEMSQPRSVNGAGVGAGAAVSGWTLDSVVDAIGSESTSNDHVTVQTVQLRNRRRESSSFTA